MAVTIDGTNGITTQGVDSQGTIKLDGNYPTGTNNVALGDTAFDSVTSGGSNTAIGSGALTANTTASNNTAIGSGALTANTTASNNTAVGYQAGYTQNGTTQDNTYLGYQAGYINTARSNAFLGAFAGYAATSGGFNTFVGCSAGDSVTSGSKNTIIGRYNGNQGGLDIRTANNHIVLSDGDGNPRGFFDNVGHFMVGKAGYDAGLTGFQTSGTDGRTFLTSNNADTLYVNRKASDGKLIELVQDGSVEGFISVSGTTVSYNGGHLSRWSRLADDSKDTSIVKGTVMTNLDAMVEWGDEDNEQLNKMAVSSIEGDANVAGVFVNWDDDDWNDMNIAMTGDMVIRIAQGTTVARGDLLMSAGDGTAKPQGDDIVRSKTIAKVTSIHVSHTYDDGSYLVPCVLMAC